MASARLVNLSTKAIVNLVEAVASTVPEKQDKIKFQKECNDLIGEAKAPELIRKLLEQRDAVLAMPSVDDVEGCFGILFSLLFKTADATQVPLLASDIASALLEKVDDRAVVRLQLATNFYNMLPSAQSGHFQVLLQVITYANEAKLLSLMGGFIASVEDWVESMDLPSQDRRALYLLIADALANDGDGTKSQVMLMNYLASFDGACAADLASVKAVAARGAIGAIKAPIVSFTQKHNLLGMAAVKQLESDPQYSKVFDLLRIFSVEKLGAYLKFAEANPDVMKDHNIDHDLAVSNMRLLSLCSLATEHEEVPYQAAASTLRVTPEGVEEWVLKAIQAGLMDAKMDQLLQVVVIRRCTNRVFGNAQWKNLKTRLHTWHSNVSGLLSTVRKSNELYATQKLQAGVHEEAPRAGSRGQMAYD